jgi:hypothetical protein
MLSQFQNQISCLTLGYLSLPSAECHCRCRDDTHRATDGRLLCLFRICSAHVARWNLIKMQCRCCVGQLKGTKQRLCKQTTRSSKDTTWRRTSTVVSSLIHITRSSPLHQGSPENIKTMAQQAQVSGYTHEDPWDTDWLRVDDLHELYYEQYGKKDGKPGT